MTISGLAANRRPHVVAPRSPRIIYQWIARVPGRQDLTRKLLSGTRLIKCLISLPQTQGARQIPLRTAFNRTLNFKDTTFTFEVMLF